MCVYVRVLLLIHAHRCVPYYSSIFFDNNSFCQDAQEMDRMRSWMYKLKRRKALKQFERELAEEEKDQVAKNKVQTSCECV